MASKNRILEPYGYRDQNGLYTPEDVFNRDIAGIKKVNDEQTTEIKDLQEDTVSLETFLAYASGTSASISGLCDAIAQEKTLRESGDTALNDRIDKILSGGTIDDLVKALEEEKQARIDGDDEILDIIDEILDQLSGTTESIDNLEDELNALSGNVDTLSGIVFSLSGDVASLSGDVASLSGDVDSLSAQTEDEAIIRANADDEIWDKLAEISGQTVDLSGITHDIQVISGNTLMNTQKIESLGDAITRIGQQSNINSGRIDDLYDLIGVSGSTIISGLTATVNAHSEAISAMTDELSAITQELADEKTAISGIQTTLDTKADKSDLDEYAKKADLDAVSGDVVVLEAKMTSVEGDILTLNNITNVISGTANTALFNAVEAKETANNAKEIAQDTLDGLAQEILDRQNGDASLLGTSGDASTEITIYGTRKLISVTTANTLAEANAYTDQKFNWVVEDYEDQISDLRDEIYGKLNDYATWSGLSKTYATKEYVDSGDAQTYFDSKAYAEEYTNATVLEVKECIDTVESAVTRNTNNINHITSYDFNDNPEGYEDTGTGVLDVLHREFHDLVIHTSGITASTIWATDDTSLQGEIKSASGDTAGLPMISIAKDGQLLIRIEGAMYSLNEILKGLVGETY